MQSNTITQSNTVRQLARLALAIALSAGIHSAQAEAGGTLEIKLGENITRTYDDLKQAGYVYGPKQEFDASTKETRIYLPYGTKGVYFETEATRITDPEPGHPAMMMNGRDGYTGVRWGYKLHFDKPISGFRMFASGGEIGLKNAVAGVEYSTDGQKWVTLKETDKSGNVGRFLDPTANKATGLKTQDLFIRFYSRSKTDPTATHTEGAWFKIWTAGDPSWGDASTTFFKTQPQVWVTAAE